MQVARALSYTKRTLGPVLVGGAPAPLSFPLPPFEQTLWFLFGAAIGGFFLFLLGVQVGVDWADRRKVAEERTFTRTVGGNPFI